MGAFCFMVEVRRNHSLSRNRENVKMEGSGGAVPLIFMCGSDGAFGQAWLGRMGMAETVAGVDG